MKQLTAKFVAAVTQPGKYHDGDAGLYLFVRERAGNVSKQFVQRLTVHGKRVDIGLGSTKWMPLTDARATAQANRRIARTGGDPRKGRATVPTFADGVDAVIEIQRGGWRNAGKSEAQWRASLRDYAIPRLGAKPVNAITTADVLAVLVPIWHDKHETARRVRQRIGKVLDWAVAEGHRADNPAGPALSAALPSNGHHRKHHRALPYSDVGGALAAVRASAAYPTTKLAFAFMVLTAARSGEVRGATWSEIDMDAAVWTVPGDRIKSGREHRVPLTTAALDVLREAAQYRGPLRAGVPVRTRQDHERRDDREAARRERRRRCSAWFPVELPPVGSGADEHSPRGRRVRACSRGRGCGGTCLPAQRFVRPAARPDGRMGALRRRPAGGGGENRKLGNYC